ncbi:hypothetical protein PsAD46_01345 [Pseudovibrio sp. Ad46]|nr:hypothetical protein PsAD46_01345 [Pseudovibrio sp. Ad46]
MLPVLTVCAASQDIIAVTGINDVADIASDNYIVRSCAIQSYAFVLQKFNFAQTRPVSKLKALNVLAHVCNTQFSGLTVFVPGEAQDLTLCFIIKTVDCKIRKF